MRKQHVVRLAALAAALAGWSQASSDTIARANPQASTPDRLPPERGVQRSIAWETSFEAAKQQAAREGKPILLLNLFGRLDEEFC
jgi:hypothetical protein